MPHFLSKTDVPVKGSIVNVCSMASLGGGAAGAAYTTSKHALLGLSRSTAFMYRKDGIRCNAVFPGGVATNMMQNIQVTMDSVGYQSLAAFHACAPGAPMDPRDIANAVLFLATAPSVNGAELAVDQGWSSAI